LMVAQKVAALLAMPSGHDPRGMFW
jgi:hypothetical protein